MLADNNSENTAIRRRGKGKPWIKGKSGNPAGRPRGVINKRTMLTNTLLEKFDNSAGEITQTIINLARDGNPAALRIFAEHVFPKERPLQFNIPEGLAGSQFMDWLITALSAGILLPAEAASIAAFVQMRERLRTEEERIIESVLSQGCPIVSGEILADVNAVLTELCVGDDFKGKFFTMLRDKFNDIEQRIELQVRSIFQNDES